MKIGLKRKNIWLLSLCLFGIIWFLFVIEFSRINDEENVKRLEVKNLTCPIFVNMSTDYHSYRISISNEKLEIDLANMNIKPGGKWSPVGCTPPYKLAIIIPYKNRLENLNILLRNLHPFLIDQNAYYGVYLLEHDDDLLFNKGILMNSGFMEVQQEDDYDCFIFHDVDMIPENDNIVYNCSRQAPKLIASSINEFNYS